MSRIGNLPVPVPAGVTVEVADGSVRVSGPLGKLEQNVDPRLRIAVGDAQVRVERDDDERETKALHGLTRNLVQNMVTGVTEGYQKSLQVVGVGYSAKLQGRTLVLQIGYSHPVKVEVPQDLTVPEPETGSMLIVGVGAVPCITIRVRGIDKQRVGEFAASLRRLKPPEPYKAKGIRYEGEEIRRKAGKAFAAQE
jgi:large subunit ribosomal protein L6